MFAAVADLANYHVFLMVYGGYDLLSVTSQTPEAFRIESQNPASTIAFSWRIVAKRKDIAGARFEPVTVPPEPTLPGDPGDRQRPASRSMRRGSRLAAERPPSGAPGLSASRSSDGVSS